MVDVCGINAAEANRVSLRYIAEDSACWGVTPANGKTREMRITGSELGVEKETQISQEIRADKMISNVSETLSTSGGSISGEFSIGTYDDFLEALIGGTWSKPMTFDRFGGAGVSWLDTDTLVVPGSRVDYFVTGRKVKIEGFLTPGNNGYRTVLSVALVTGSTQVTFTETTAVAEAGNAFCVVMDANDYIFAATTIRAGTAGARTFDSNGGNAFAAFLSLFRAGQKVHVEGLGYSTRVITFTAQPVDGDLLTLNDGVNTVTFEINTNLVFSRANIVVALGATFADTIANLVAAINLEYAKGNTKFYAKTNGTDTLTVTNTNAGLTAAATETLSNATMAAASTALAISGVYTVASIADDVLTVVEPVPTFANAGSLLVTFKASSLRSEPLQANIIKRSFSVETSYNDVSQHFMQTGLRVGSFENEITAGDIASIDIALQGKSTSAGSVSILGNAPYTPLVTTSTEVLNATVNVGEVKKNGAVLASAIRTIGLSISDSLRNQTGVGSKFPIGIGGSSVEITGSLEAYFETLDLFNDFINHRTISVDYNFKDNQSNAIYFSLPAVKLTTDTFPPSGVNTDIIEQIEFIAQRDPVLETQFICTRFSSLIAPTA